MEPGEVWIRVWRLVKQEALPTFSVLGQDHLSAENPSLDIKPVPML
jgi:hypothetical protein